MALGDQRSNGSKKMFENTYYSRIGFSSEELRLGFSYKSGMIVAEISKPKDGTTFEFESLVSIFITPIKARMLMNKIAEFDEYVKNGGKDPKVGFGINAGMGEVSSVLILHVNDLGNRCVTIGKITADGSFNSKYTYIFNQDYHYSLKWNNIDDMNFEKSFENDVEFDMFTETIKSFALNSNGAIAYTVADIARYDTKSILNKMNPIYDKLGIERQSYGGGKSENNFFSRSSSGNSTHKSFDDAMNGISDYDED